MWQINALLCLFLTVQHTWGQPILDTSTHNIALTSGNAAVLSCQVSNLGDAAKVIWIGPSGTTLTYGRQRITADDRISVEQPYLRDWNLYIRHAKPRDAGTYICKVTTNPPQTKKVHLQIRVAPTINHDLTTKSPQTVAEGQNITLTCVVSAEPPASIMWIYFNPNNPDAKDQFPKSVTGETIKIHNITREEAGIYTCQAFNGIPPVSKKNITVNVEFPPSVSTSIAKISQDRGRDTSIDCIIKAYPQEIAVWRKGHTEILEDENVWKFVPTLYRRSDTEFVLNLQIYTLEEGDFGLYTCEAKNQYGNSSSTVLIEENVVTKPSTTTTTTTTRPSTTTTLYTSTVTSASTNTTLSSALTTTTQKGLIIDEKNSSDNYGVVEPPYSVITTPVIKPPDGQGGSADGVECIRMRWWSLAIIITSVIVVL